MINKLLIQKEKTTKKNNKRSKSMAAQQGAMTALIERVLQDPETRERLLDHSVLNDFFFEERLKEKRLQVLQEQKNINKRKSKN